MCLLCAVERQNQSVPGDLRAGLELGTRGGQRFLTHIKDFHNQNALPSVLVVFSVANLLPVQPSVLGRYGKQMLVAGRRSRTKPRSSHPRRPGDGRVGLAATGSTACNESAMQKTRRMKKTLPRLGLIRSQRRSSVHRKNSSAVLLSALKVKQLELELMRDFLSKVCQRLEGRSHFSFFSAPCERQVTQWTD